MVLFDEICIALQGLGYDVVTVKPNSFPPNMVYVHIADMEVDYESNMVIHMPVEIRIEYVDDAINLMDDKASSIILAIERRIATAIPAAVGTFKFRKPLIIHLGTAIKVALRCTYTKVMNI